MDRRQEHADGLRGHGRWQARGGRGPCVPSSGFLELRETRAPWGAWRGFGLGVAVLCVRAYQIKRLCVCDMSCFSKKKPRSRKDCWLADRHSAWMVTGFCRDSTQPSR
jgi:hypothetical protein